MFSHSLRFSIPVHINQVPFSIASSRSLKSGFHIGNLYLMISLFQNVINQGTFPAIYTFQNELVPFDGLLGESNLEFQFQTMFSNRLQ